VKSFEAVDARILDTAFFHTPPRFLTFDVSFISLNLVLPAVLPLAGVPACLVALIKPQFEVGPGHAVKGIVKDETLHGKVCADVSTLIQSLGWTIAGLIRSPIQGGEGNVEYLIGARRL
jgi:23S rRNA (cytidine1920-2'-O)/16S rRNA (cytidine1409-2'-O)-methyltransferase